MKRIVNSPSAITIARMLVMVLPLLTAPIVARELGPEGRGYYAACVAAITLIPVIVGFGIPLAIRRRAVRERSAALVRGVYFITPVLLLASTGIGFLVRYTFLADLPDGTAWMFIIGTTISALTVITLAIQSILIAHHRYLAIAVVQSAQTVFISIGILIGWILGAISVSWLIGCVIVAIVLTLLVSVYNKPVGIRGPRAWARPLIVEGASYTGSQVSEVASTTAVQIVAITFIGPYESGLFAISMTIASLSLVFGYTVGIVAFPQVARASRQDAVRIAADALRSSLFLGTSATMVLMALTPWAVPFLFGADFSPSVPSAMICLLSGPLVVFNYVSSQFLAAFKLGWRMTAAQVVGLSVSLVLVVVLGSGFGAVGAAWAVVTGRLSTTLMSMYFLPTSVGSLAPRLSDVTRTFELVSRGRPQGST